MCFTRARHLSLSSAECLPHPSKWLASRKVTTMDRLSGETCDVKDRIQTAPREKIFIIPFTLQQQNITRASNASIESRINKLKHLKQIFIAHRKDLQESMYKDYNKPAPEVDLAEIFVLLNEFITESKSSFPTPRRKWMPTSARPANRRPMRRACQACSRRCSGW